MSIEALREAEAEARAFLNIESERRARYGWNGLREGMERFADSQRAYQERWPAAVDAFAAAVRATLDGELAEAPSWINEPPTTDREALMARRQRNVAQLLREEAERKLAALDGEYEALVEAAAAFDAFIQMVDSGMTVFPLDREHEDSEPKVYERVREALGAALQPFLARRGR